MSDRPDPHVPRFRIVETIVAVGVLLSTWEAVDDVLGAYPTWLYLGDVTIPTFVVAPTALALVVVGELLVLRRLHGGFRRPEFALGALASVTILAVTYAVLDLNLTAPGLFWAGFFPLVSGFLLAIGVLLSRGIALVRRRARIHGG